MYFYLALTLTAVTTFFATKAARRPYRTLDAAEATVYILAVAVSLTLVGATLYTSSPMQITPREDYSDPFGGTSACVPVVESEGYDGTWLAPWLTADTTPHQVGTVCWNTPATDATTGH